MVSGNTYLVTKWDRIRSLTNNKYFDDVSSSSSSSFLKLLYNRHIPLSYLRIDRHILLNMSHI